MNSHECVTKCNYNEYANLMDHIVKIKIYYSNINFIKQFKCYKKEITLIIEEINGEIPGS